MFTHSHSFDHHIKESTIKIRKTFPTTCYTTSWASVWVVPYHYFCYLCVGAIHIYLKLIWNLVSSKAKAFKNRSFLYASFRFDFFLVINKMSIYSSMDLMEKRCEIFSHNLLYVSSLYTTSANNQNVFLSIPKDGLW